MLRDHSAKVQNVATTRQVQDDVMFDCNNLRYFIAVAETESTIEDGWKLRVTKQTVAWRVATLVESQGLSLIELRTAGYATHLSGEIQTQRCLMLYCVYLSMS